MYFSIDKYILQDRYIFKDRYLNVPIFENVLFLPYVRADYQYKVRFNGRETFLKTKKAMSTLNEQQSFIRSCYSPTR